ncbi:MAG: sigma-70 family RNA polymerase sigma factor [Bacteroidia bacterium]|nr:sigma-70 family RNA polymerase sigma factor [Bacteroidia bacterium]
MKSNNLDTDSEIIERIKKGDTSAFRFLVEKYKDVSFSLACSILRNENIAEDALQESFIKVYHNIDKFRNHSSFPTWLYRIVVNTCLTFAKRQKKQQLFIDINTVNNIEIDTGETGIDRLMASERSAIINNALNRIKSDESLLLRLFYLSELDLQEIMKVTGFKESKIKVTLFRARKNLLIELQRIFGNELILKL